MTNPGRNDPCSCGSGKKFKKCCGVPKQSSLSKASMLFPSQAAGKMSSLFHRNVTVKKIEKEEKEES